MVPRRGGVCEADAVFAAARRAALVRFREGVYGCFRRRADALFELVDAVLESDVPVGSLVELSTRGAFRRGHGALYDALACGDVDTEALARVIAGAWAPADEGPLKFAVDVSAWDRPDAPTSAELHHCHASCRCGNRRGTVPGWPYSVVAGVEWGASSWSVPLDARRIALAEDATVVTVGQVAAVLERLEAAGALAGRPAPVFAFDSGYDLTRIAYLAGCRGLGVQVLGRIRGDRVFYDPPGPRLPGDLGRPAVHGGRFELADPATWEGPDEQLTGLSPRYGRVVVCAWHGLHQKLARRAGWERHAGALPVVAGTVIRVEVERLPGDRAPENLWLWHHAPEGTVFDLDLLWKTYLRRFDIEHTFRLFKQRLGWTAPQIRTPAQADRWTWLILTAYTQLRLARTLTGEMRRPWQRPTLPGRMPTPGRVHRGFRALRRKLGTPARTPKPARPGPGRPKGSTRPPRERFPVGKNPDKHDRKPGGKAARPRS